MDIIIQGEGTERLERYCRQFAQTDMIMSILI